MTSITFPFVVGLPGEDKKIPFTDAEFRYTTRFARQLEKAAGTNLTSLLVRGQSVEALVLLVCYGLRWTTPKLTEEQAVDRIDEFVDAGGDTVALFAALHDGLYASGVYGKPRTDATSEGEAEGERPLA